MKRLFAFGCVMVACGSQATTQNETTTIAPAAPATSSSAAAPIPPPAPMATDAGEEAATPVACHGTMKTGETTETISIGGMSRTFIVHVPPGYDGAKRVPLVFDFHPLSVSASLWKLATGWSGVADKNGFVLVWPQGYQDSWNVGRCCSPAHDANVDDVAFVRAMIAKIEADACIDAKRVYATGCSNGGGLTYRLACDAADVIAAGAPVDFDCITGPTNSPSCGACAPSRPMSITQFRCQGDKSVPYDGGPTSVVAGLEFPGAKANFADWAARNACSGSPASDPAHPGCDTYSKCGGATSTTLCTIPVGTHCGNYIPFGIADVAWDALSKSSLP